MTKKELIERGNNLAEKYSVDELNTALRNALSVNDEQERLALQWALKNKTHTKDGWAFTKAQQQAMHTKLRA